MPAYEYVGNLHVHTYYSDGEAYHDEVADAALLAGLDFVVFTDHNVHLDGIEGYYGDEERGYVLLLSGEEVHDRTRLPQCNHLLAFGAGQELALHAHNLGGLVETINRAGGLSFIAHPNDRAVSWLGEGAIPWADRYVRGFTGLEVWNFMSRFKDLLSRRREAFRNVLTPEDAMVSPPPDALALWDELLAEGQRVVGIGGADAHGTHVRYGPLTRTVFPYDFLFSAINTHILTPTPLVGELEHDRALLYGALKAGRVFIGYDIPGPTRGFRFTAQGQNTSAIVGESIRLGHGVTLQALAPGRGRIRIIRHGEVVAEERKVENLTYVAREPGAYRVEMWRAYHDVERTWILSNPIYVEPSAIATSRPAPAAS